ncbi:hypothetical protein [Mycolicibacterium neoaurum]|uniref:NLP/P60 family protein n=1 Tax=Mycolicibacterium neoaurum TaxID=1795 RepID=A0AAV2WGZ4_MYCNE|nr:hypothetical protein [Mycolicibacterium neoaurum]TLH56698.1 hypothetical protein C1S81_19490 [Mycolicibacterium neoaurum]CDQ43444.1 NLP/P60 family protein [Mycolicibacterium neoaurum]
MARHGTASGRYRSSAALAAILAPAAILFSVGSEVRPQAPQEPMTVAGPAAAPVVPGVQIVAAPADFAWNSSTVSAAAPATPTAQLVAASRWRPDNRPLLLPPGVAPEHGLQVKTILTARAISVVFPEIRSIGGVRPDALRWHPNGLALDVMIPNPGSAQGIALGNQIVAYVMKNAARFGMQDAIWRGTYYTPTGASGSGGYGHYDHVHVTTTGGGYPTGDEVYYR